MFGRHTAKPRRIAHAIVLNVRASITEGLVFGKATGKGTIVALPAMAISNNRWLLKGYEKSAQMVVFDSQMRIPIDSSLRRADEPATY